MHARTTTRSTTVGNQTNTSRKPITLSIDRLTRSQHRTRVKRVSSNPQQQIPDRDNAGNVIPDWKRQMLAKKAAERAKREFEERMAKEAEDRRLSAIPQWKRDLMARREEAETKFK